MHWKYQAVVVVEVGGNYPSFVALPPMMMKKKEGGYPDHCWGGRRHRLQRRPPFLIRVEGGC